MSELVIKAVSFATEQFEGEIRKVSGEMKINHMIRVAKTLKEAGFSDELVAAGLLHDTVEDTDTTIEDIASQFGEIVAKYVASHTENKTLSWEERKQHTIDSVATASLETKALIVADKLDNLTSLMQDYALLGESIWELFNRGKEKQAWYFRGVAENMYIGLEGEAIPDYFYTYEEKVDHFFG